VKIGYSAQAEQGLKYIEFKQSKGALVAKVCCLAEPENAIERLKTAT